MTNEARRALKEPFYAHDPDVVDHDGYTGFGPGNDFNREVIVPGENEVFPEGAVGIRIDDDFWIVAALPYDEYKETSIQDIVAKFWPECTNVCFRQDSVA